MGRRIIRYGLTFVVLSGASVTGAWWLPSLPMRLVLAYLATAFLAVALGYLSIGPTLFMKRHTGRFHPASLVLFWPYHLMNFAAFGVLRMVFGYPPYVEVTPGIYLGRRLNAAEAQPLRVAGVVDLAGELPENHVMRQAQYLSLPVLDKSCPTMAQLHDGVRWLQATLAHGPVYVHCALGYARGPTLVAAYLLWIGEARSAGEAITAVTSKRPGVSLHRSQRRALEAFAESLKD